MQNIALQHSSEIASGERFEFGKNWTAFLAVLDDERIVKAEESLKDMLEVDDLERQDLSRHRLRQRAVFARREAVGGKGTFVRLRQQLFCLYAGTAKSLLSQ